MGRHVASVGAGGVGKQIVIVLAALALVATSMLYVVFADTGRNGVTSAGAQPRPEHGGAAGDEPTDGSATSEPRTSSARPSPTDSASGSTPTGAGGSTVTTESDVPPDTPESEEPEHSSGPPSSDSSERPEKPSPGPDRTSAPPTSGSASPAPPSEPPGSPTSKPTSRPTVSPGNPSPAPTTLPPERPDPPRPTHKVEVRSALQALGTFVTMVKVENNSTEPLRWELGLVYDQVSGVSADWGADVDLDGDKVVASGEGSTAVLEPGDDASFGFMVHGTSAGPTSCTIAGADCTIEND